MVLGLRVLVVDDLITVKALEGVVGCVPVLWLGELSVLEWCAYGIGCCDAMH